LQRYEAQLRQARAEAYQTLEAQRKEALTARQQLIEQVKQETAVQIAAAKGELASQTERARQNLETEARTRWRRPSPRKSSIVLLVRNPAQNRRPATKDEKH
jgi:hypothetical protein